MRLPTLAAALLLGSLAVAALRSAEPQPPWSKMDTSQKIEQLLVRIENLEARVDQLQRHPSPAPLLIPGPGQPVPKGWQPHRFNGMDYYTILCTEPGTGTVAPASIPTLK